jgi:aquaporin Z
MEACLLGGFMISACTIAVLVFHPDSSLAALKLPPIIQRALMGLGMGLTAIGLFYSPFGRRSGAHINPAMTLVFLRLGRLSGREAAGYMLGQLVGAAAGVALMALILRAWIAHPSVQYVVTKPGPWGLAAAWTGEFVITCLLVTAVMAINRIPRLAPYTGLFVGLLVAGYITLESPISGMSMNPARTFGSALWAEDWTAFWIYLTAPPLGMLTGAELHRRLSRRPASHLCGKLSHSKDDRCIFSCNCLAPDSKP